MTTGARTFSIKETLLEPQALTPPPTRHALFACLIALACDVFTSARRAGASFTVKPTANMPAPRAK